MNKKIKFLTGASLCLTVLLGFTGCMDEVVPTDGLTEGQVEESPNSVEGLLMAMPARFNALDARTGNFGDYGIGYGGLMHVRDVMTEDMSITDSDYDHFRSWEQNINQGEQYVFAQWLWNYQWTSVLAANKLMGTVKDIDVRTDLDAGAKGAAHAFRAFLYLDLARSYEFLPNDVFSGTNEDGNDVTNLTVPIVTEETTEEQTKNNPRVPRDKMFEFILEDLDSAEVLLPRLDRTKYATDKTLPHLAAVYGLKARLYMWVEDYPKAAEYAQKAIQESGLTPIGYADCLVITSDGYIDGYQPDCFNNIDKWMWGVSQTSSNSTVTSGILNWTSWMAVEATFGYAAAGAKPCIYIPMLNRIDATDWRQFLWDPSTSVTAPGCSHKFQPNEGNGSVHTIGAAASYPLMRVEEMWFIYAEAMAHTNAQAGKTILESFMNSYRSLDGSYRCNVTSQEDVIEEIVFQKRVELWGEGQTFFDIKRLNYSVDRAQEGSNFYDLAKFRTNGRPAWMNWVVVQTEQNSNAALDGWNNPDPSDKYKPVN